MNNVASMYWGLGKLRRIHPVVRGDAQIKQERRRSCNNVWVIANLGANYLAASQLDEVPPLFEEAFKKVQEKHASNLELTTFCTYSLADIYLRVGRFDEAVRLREGDLRLHKEKLGPDHLVDEGFGNGLSCSRASTRLLPLFGETLNLHKEKLSNVPRRCLR